MRLEECAHRARAACIACFPCHVGTGMHEPFCVVSLLLAATRPGHVGMAPSEPGPKRPGPRQGDEQPGIVRHAPGPEVSLSAGGAS